MASGRAGGLLRMDSRVGGPRPATRESLPFFAGRKEDDERSTGSEGQRPVFCSTIDLANADHLPAFAGRRVRWHRLVGPLWLHL